MPLTETEIRKAKPADKAFKMTDGRGLYLLVTPAGSKLWRWKYRVDGKEKVMAVGTYPDMNGPQARMRHEDERRKLLAGIDPMAQTWSRPAQIASVQALPFILRAARNQAAHPQAACSAWPPAYVR